MLSLSGNLLKVSGVRKLLIFANLFFILVIYGYFVYVNLNGSHRFREMDPGLYSIIHFFIFARVTFLHTMLSLLYIPINQRKEKLLAFEMLICTDKLKENAEVSKPS
jgi:hypothetical protein